ncbi:8361_t:CDS:1 [Funneliformis geosporum]|nr:8361_t:CDS:1 [Funneliformis geosporum]
MLKDMISQLAVVFDGRAELVRKLDYPKGYISQIKRRKFYKVSGRLTKSNPFALVLKEINCAKSIISRMLDMINHKDDVDFENFLNDSDEEDKCHVSSPRVNTPPTFSTPKKKRTKM